MGPLRIPADAANAGLRHVPLTHPPSTPSTRIELSALDVRVTHIDTTEPYGPFHSEEIGP